MFIFIIEKHCINIAVDFVVSIGFQNILVGFVIYKIVLKTFSPRDFIKSRCIVICADSSQIYLRFDFGFFDNQFHWETSDDMICRFCIDKPLMIAGQVWNNINFAVLEFVQEVSPIIENNVLKFAGDIIFKKFHVLISVAGGMSGAIFVHKAGVDDVADFQFAVFVLNSWCGFNSGHKFDDISICE